MAPSPPIALRRKQSSSHSAPTTSHNWPSDFRETILESSSKIYQDKKILEKDPFASIDVEGVGSLVRTGVQLGRKTRPDLKLGICGEHGGDPASVHFFHEVGLDYVSASPYRILVARRCGGPGGAVGKGRRLITIFVHREGRTEASHERRSRLAEPACWRDVLDRSRLAVHPGVADPQRYDGIPSAFGGRRDERASVSEAVEAYDGYLYVVLHAIDYTRAVVDSRLTTSISSRPELSRDRSHRGSRGISDLLRIVPRNPRILADGPVPLFHRIIDAMVDHYRPEIEKPRDRLDDLEKKGVRQSDRRAGS